MYAKYGSYIHDQGEINLSISARSDFVNGMEKAYTIRWDLRGRLQIPDQGSTAANQNLMIPKIEALLLAYSIQGQDLVFYTDNGVATAHALISALSYGGVRVVQRPSFPTGYGAEHLTYRNYGIGVEATFLNPYLSILEYRETISFTGGGQKFVMLETAEGYPQKQYTRQNTIYKCVQRGAALGMFSYPIPPNPISPGDLHEDQGGPEFVGPDFSGPIGARAFDGYRTTWAYFMESANPISGLPTIPLF
jgi:hypothetical protein